MQVLLTWKIIVVSTVLFQWLVEMRCSCDYLCSRIRL